MITKLLIMFFIFLWLACRGILEGMVWKRYLRLYLLDYHGWRVLENIGIMGALISSNLAGGFDAIPLIIGAYIFGTFVIYERLLNKIYYNECFTTLKRYYMCFGVPFKRLNSILEFIIAFIVGGLLIFVGFQ